MQGLYLVTVLRLNSISIFQFKNYSNRNFLFPSKVTGICGKNGVGKTNLLDAIHYLCFTRSYFTRLDLSNVQHGKSGFRIEGNITVGEKTETVVCIHRETGKKEFTVNGEAYERFSTHIGRYTCVIIAPDDAVLVTGGSEERRRFIDAMLSQADPVYLKQLINYHKILQQRNSFLRINTEKNPKDPALLDVLDEQLLAPANYIFNKRKEFLVSFLPAVKHLYNEISRQPEDLNLIYESALISSPLNELLKAARHKDILLQRSTVGIHRDDLDFLLNNQPFKSIASQGQRKSLLFALRLAEMELLQKEKGFAPILLLDDVFEKLDEDRIQNLLVKVCKENEGQVFITDTNEARLRSHLQEVDTDFKIISL